MAAGKGDSSKLLNDNEMNFKTLICQYLDDNSRVFTSLQKVRALGWGNSAGDEHFSRIRSTAEKQHPLIQKNFLKMMQNTGRAMQEEANLFDCKKAQPCVLDIGAAPGGFTSIVLEFYQQAQVLAVTLPEQVGGYRFLLRHDKKDARVQLRYLDTTLLGLEHGLDETELSTVMSKERLWPGTSFDLVYCGGTMTQSIKSSLNDYSDRSAADILRYSQLVIGIRRLAQGGTLVLVLHKAESWVTMCILHSFSKFSKTRLFKSKRGHATRSAFYLVAKDVQTDSEAAKIATEEWKKIWYHLVTSKGAATNPAPAHQEPALSEVRHLLDTFGEELVRLAEPIWKIQHDAIKKAPWFNGLRTMLLQPQ